MWWNIFTLALREIRRHVLRSTLTILGIVIGVAAVIILVTIGEGATLQVRQQIASMGSNLLMLTPGRRMGPGHSGGNVPFKLADAEAILAHVDSIAAIAPVSMQSTEAIFGNENWSTQVVGSDGSYLTVTNRALKTGRPFREGEIRGGGAVCLIGETVRKNLFFNQSGVGQRLRLAKLSCEIIGELAAKGQSAMGSDQDDVVIIPLSTFQRRISGTQDVSMIQISVAKDASTTKVQMNVAALMRERRHLTPKDEDNFNLMDMREIAQMLTGTTQLLTALLSAVAAVSLIVGGIGIMNIMLVSVTERTREIGIRRAIGAYDHEVLLQFLVEAVALSSLGGIAGIVLALVASFLISLKLGVPFVLNFGIIALAFLFSAGVGVIFGYFPARKAAQLDPIDALRHE